MNQIWYNEIGSIQFKRFTLNMSMKWIFFVLCSVSPTKIEKKNNAKARLHDRHINGVNIEHPFGTWHQCNLVLSSPSLISHTPFFFSLSYSSPILCYCHLNFPNMWQTVHLTRFTLRIRPIANDSLYAASQFNASYSFNDEKLNR